MNKEVNEKKKKYAIVWNAPLRVDINKKEHFKELW